MFLQEALFILSDMKRILKGKRSRWICCVCCCRKLWFGEERMYQLSPVEGVTEQMTEEDLG